MFGIGEMKDELRETFTGLNDLDPDSAFIQALGSSRIKEGVIYHSIIGDREQADHAGGSDGVVPYSSSHLNGAASEVIVRSGHSVHRSPAAMRELLRILLLHLREEQPATRENELDGDKNFREGGSGKVPGKRERGSPRRISDGVILCTTLELNEI